MDVLQFFAQHMDAFPIFQELERLLTNCVPDARRKVSKTQISYSNPHIFAMVSFNPCRRAKDRPEVWLTLSFGLGYRKDSRRIDAVEAYPNRWTHHVMIGSIEELNDELLSWLQEAAAFSKNRR